MFSASHQLFGLEEGHPCGRVHGHNYVVRVTLVGDGVGSTGFLCDYGVLWPFGVFLDATLDHRHLNDVLAGQPSAELLAVHLHRVLGSLNVVPPGVTARVAVSETPKTWAEFTP